MSKGKSSNTNFDVEDLFELANIAFAVEIALAVARKDTSVVQIKNKQDLCQVLTNRETLGKVLEQGLITYYLIKRHSMIHLGSNNYRKITGTKSWIIL